MEGRHLYQEPALVQVKPAPVVPASFSTSPEAGPYRAHGEDLLRKGKVAALVVAGGQGSRLGIDAPKGVVGVTPVTGKSLFQLHAERCSPCRKYGQAVPLFVMTSRAVPTLAISLPGTRFRARPSGCLLLRPGHVALHHP